MPHHRRLLSRVRGCALALAAFCGVAGMAGAAEFPEGIRYTLQAQSYLQQQSNPFRFSDANAAERQSDLTLTNSVRGAMVVPLLSNRTRLDLSGTYGDARYNRYRQLDHRPARLDANLRWRAGDLFAGSVGYVLDDRLYRYLNNTYPERDLVRSRALRAEAGLRVTESLTLPLVSVSSETRRYEYPDHVMLFDRRTDRVQVAARYTGWHLSSVTAGVWQASGRYPNRTDEWVALVDRRYREREAFVDAQWSYSPKTVLGAQVGFRKRTYPDLTERNADMWTLRLRAGWDYSVKTRFDFNLWRHPYANDENPAILYSTLTGARAAVRWQATPKLWLSFNVVRENQDDTLASGSTVQGHRALRFGPRIEWEAHRNVKLVLDGWHDRVRGSSAGGSYVNNVVRLGIVLTHDNGSRAPLNLVYETECDPPKFLENPLCE